LRAQRAAIGQRGDHFVVLVHLRGDDAPTRLGIVASRKVGSAVARNRGKRRVREWFRRSRDLPRGADVVVILREGAPDRGQPEAARELDATLAKAVAKARRAAAGAPPAPSVRTDPGARRKRG
jgi:ribonuclease P protein component